MTKQELLEDINLYLKLASKEEKGSFGQWSAELLLEAKKFIS